MNLDPQHHDARDLLRAIRSGDDAALSLLRRHHPRWAAADPATVRQLASLHDAQSALAREHGYPPPSLPPHTRLFVADMAWIADRADGLLRTLHSAGPAALEQVRHWHPRFHGLSDHEILDAPFTEEDALLVYAREHGFDTWDDLAARVNLLAADPAARAAEPFLTAFTALASGDVTTFESLLQTHPNLARERGTNGNTLLNLAVSLASRPDSQSGLAPIHALLASGTDVNQPNDRGWTPLHAAAYANRPEIAALLIEHGAALDAEAHGAGGTPLIVALFWGHREVSDLLGRHSPSPGNLRAAAGLGLPDLVDACFRPDGSLTPEAVAARGFYRPHSGFPDWQPSTDPQEVLDEALVWACKSDRVEVLERLVAAGARLDADPYRGTPLIWAAVCNRPRAVAWLLDRGAQIDRKATFGGLTHGQGITALHLAAQNGHMPVIRLLIERGANRAIQDDLYHSTPEGAAAFFNQVEARDYLRSPGA